jgi:hypothetical protein
VFGDVLPAEKHSGRAAARDYRPLPPLWKDGDIGPDKGAVATRTSL